MLENANVSSGIVILLENITEIAEHPDASFALLGILLLIFFGFYMRKIKLTLPILINVSLMLALALILYQMRLYHFPQGGSITFGSVIPLLLLSFRYGAGIGTLAGFMYGLIMIIQDPFILHPIQVLFDYPLPYMAFGLAGILKDRIFMGTILAFTGKFICHFISGVIFFSSYAPEGYSATVYSLVTNLTYIVPEMIICLVLMKVLPMKRLLAAMDRNRD